MDNQRPIFIIGSPRSGTTYAFPLEQEWQRSGQQSTLYDSRIGTWQSELPRPLQVMFHYWSGALLKELGYR